jgi:putative MFS transporter
MDAEVIDLEASLLVARLQRIPLSRYTLTFVLLVAGSLMIDALSSGSLAVVLPIVIPLMKLTPHLVGLLAAASALGIVIGLIPAGYLADRLGRKTLLIAGILCFCTATIISGLSTNFTMLAIFRFITGLGLAPAFIMPYALICEIVPDRTRAIFAGLIESAVALGYILGPVLGLVIIPLAGPELGWRLFFLIAGLPIFYVALIWKYLPESPRWLCRVGRTAEAERVVLSIETATLRYSQVPLPDPDPTSTVKQTSIHPQISAAMNYSAIFRPPLLKRTVVMAIGNYGLFSLFYVITIFVPSLLIKHHITIGTAYVFALIVAAGRIPWTIIGGFMADLIGRKPTFTALLSISIFGAVMFGHAQTAFGMAGWGLVLQAAAGAAPSYKMWYAELFPTYIRGTGQSVVEGIGGRLLGGVVWSFFFPVLVDQLGVSMTMNIAAGVTFVTVVIVTLFSFETRHKTLEQIEVAMMK